MHDGSALLTIVPLLLLSQPELCTEYAADSRPTLLLLLWNVTLWNVECYQVLLYISWILSNQYQVPGTWYAAVTYVSPP